MKISCSTALPYHLPRPRVVIYPKNWPKTAVMRDAIRDSFTVFPKALPNSELRNRPFWLKEGWGALCSSPIQAYRVRLSAPYPAPGMTWKDSMTRKNTGMTMATTRNTAMTISMGHLAPRRGMRLLRVPLPPMVA